MAVAQPQKTHTKPAQKGVGRLKNGATPNILTQEQRAKGGKTAAANRRARIEDAKLSARERMAKVMNAHAEELALRMVEASVEDWRAIPAAYDQAFGRPPQVVTGADGGPLQITVASAFGTLEPETVEGELVEAKQLKP